MYFSSTDVMRAHMRVICQHFSSL